MSKKLDYLTDLIRDIYGGRIPENGATLLIYPNIKVAITSFDFTGNPTGISSEAVFKDEGLKDVK